MGRRFAAAWLVFMIWIATGALAAPASQAISNATGSFVDSFGTQSYAGNDGTREWKGPWWEIGESDGPRDGGVQVKEGGNCAASSCLRISEALLQESGAARQADLEGAIAAKLTFSYEQKAGEAMSALHAKVSADGGSTWKTIGTYAASQSASVSLDITPYASAQTAIAFLVDSEMPGNTFIDDVTITAEFAVGEPTTTTTTVAPPTTMPPDVPPPSDPGPTPTTTQPPVVTTTTLPNPTTTTTTTTTPPPTTTTTAPPRATSTPTTTPPPTESTDVQDKAAVLPVTQGNPTAATAQVERANLTAAGLMDTLMAVPSTEGDVLRERRGPLKRVMATLTTSGAVLRSQLIPGVVLGTLIAWTAVAGLGRREDDEQVI